MVIWLGVYLPAPIWPRPLGALGRPAGVRSGFQGPLRRNAAHALKEKLVANREG